MAAVNAYLSFDGNCEEAFEFYRSVFGGEFAMMSRFGDLDWGMPIPDDEKLKVMHVALPIGGTVLMGSDVPTSMGPVTRGSSQSLAIGAASEDEARRIFAELSAGGNITMKFDKAPWGALFGGFTDKFGFSWMINFDFNQQA
ncbi:MAG: VOC family protein [Acidobacteriota bacterium]